MAIFGSKKNKEAEREDETREQQEARLSEEAAKLTREQLLTLLVQLSREKDELTAQLDEVKKREEERSIRLDEAGSIAEAALIVNHVYEDAQKAADEYLANIRQMKEEVEAERQAVLEEKKKAKEATRRALERESRAIEAEARAKAAEHQAPAGNVPAPEPGPDSDEARELANAELAPGHLPTVESVLAAEELDRQAEEEERALTKREVRAAEESASELRGDAVPDELPDNGEQINADQAEEDPGQLELEYADEGEGSYISASDVIADTGQADLQLEPAESAAGDAETEDPAPAGAQDEEETRNPPAENPPNESGEEENGEEVRYGENIFGDTQSVRHRLHRVKPRDHRSGDDEIGTVG